MTSRILIADDHEDNRELICFMLREALYDIREARDGHECLRLAREECPDLIMVDISMPRLDGWEVLKEVSQHTNIKLRNVAELILVWGRTGDMPAEIRVRLEDALDRYGPTQIPGAPPG